MSNINYDENGNAKVKITVTSSIRVGNSNCEEILDCDLESMTRDELLEKVNELERKKSELEDQISELEDMIDEIGECIDEITEMIVE